MSAISRITVEVKASLNYQSVGYSAEVLVDADVEPVEAIAQVQQVRALLAEQATADVKELSLAREVSQPAPSAPAPVIPAGSGHQQWAVGQKPNGKGSFRYLPTTVFPTSALKEAAASQLSSLGIDAAEVDIFDDRTGNYGLESGNTSYQPGKVKAKDGTRLSSAMQGKSIVAGIDFADDGTVKVVLTKDGKAALQALSIAAHLGGSAI